MHLVVMDCLNTNYKTFISYLIFFVIITLSENFNLFYSEIFSYYALLVLITQFVLNVTPKLFKGFFSPLLIPLEMYLMSYELVFAN
jgi:hypothetical protein